MDRFVLKLIKLAVWSLALFLPFSAMAGDVYRLHQGDTVQVSVWKEDALQLKVNVLPDGSITYPLVGRLDVAGLTTTEVEQKITEKLKAYLADPVVTVVVAATDGNRVYVLGKVLKPGVVPLDGPMTVLQVLSIAGGLDKFADGDSIKVLRGQGNAQQVLPVHYSDLLKGRDLSGNIMLQAGDTIMVP
ncbi:MAG TPA: polysaccharide biosynthesis/export family protein [Parasulfuritortus sp.]